MDLSSNRLNLAAVIVTIAAGSIGLAGCGGRAAPRRTDGDAAGSLDAGLDRGDRDANRDTGTTADGAVRETGGNGGAVGRDAGAEGLSSDGSVGVAADAAPPRDGSPATDAPPPPADGAPARDATPAFDLPGDGVRPIGDGLPPMLDAALDAAASDGGCGSLDDRHHCGSCQRDCTILPNVNGDLVNCVARSCTFTALSCRIGFADCNLNVADGCETDLSRPENCGRCGRVCPGLAPTCALNSRGSGLCGTKCDPPTPDVCGTLCTDLGSDPANCGYCGNNCAAADNTISAGMCVAGMCIAMGCQPGWADCDGQMPGCETSLLGEQNCGACGARPACALAHVESMCQAGAPACFEATCTAGYGNCNPTSADCETEWATAGSSCLPRYLGSVAPVFEELIYSAVRVAADGTLYLGGSFSGTANFDPTGGEDLRRGTRDSSGNLTTDVFVTKINANGTYGWTRILGGPGLDDLVGLALTPDGGLAVLGNFDTEIDLDPGTGVDSHTSPGPISLGAYLVKLDTSGVRVWADAWTATMADPEGAVSARALSAGADGALYISGGTFGLTTLDFDPGIGVSNQVVSSSSPFLMKVSGTGALAWTAVIGGTNCNLGIGKVAVPVGGSIWVTASFDGTCDLDPGSGLMERRSTSTSAVVLQLSPTGAYVSDSVIGGGEASVSIADIAALADGSLYLVGDFSGTVDFDAGAGVTSRASDFANFLLKLLPDGKFSWVRKVASGSAMGVGVAPGGGAMYWGSPFDPIAGQSLSSVTLLGPDQVPNWTMVVGDSATNLLGLAVGATGFVVLGQIPGPTDVDPGPGIDMLAGSSAFASRYAF